MSKMELSDVIEIWDYLHVKDTGELNFCDLQDAVEKAVGIINDIDPKQPTLDRTQKAVGEIEG